MISERHKFPTTVSSNHRGRQRAFDHAEAKRLWARGVPRKAIAEMFRVTPEAIYLAVNPEARARAIARNSAWQKNGTCPECGGKASRNWTTGQNRCRGCAAKARATSVRETTLRCIRCREWKPDSAFPANKKLAHRRCRHHYCTPCGTVVRRESRAKGQAA